MNPLWDSLGPAGSHREAVLQCKWKGNPWSLAGVSNWGFWHCLCKLGLSLRGRFIGLPHTVQAEKACTNSASKYISPQPHSVTSFLFNSENHSDLKSITLWPSNKKVQSTNVNVSFRNDDSIGILFFSGAIMNAGCIFEYASVSQAILL